MQTKTLTVPLKKIYLLPLFAAVTLMGQNRKLILQNTDNQKILIESAIVQYDHFKGNSNENIYFLQPLLTFKNSSSIALYYGLLANSVAKNIDKINSKSTALYFKSITEASKSQQKSTEIWALVNYAYHLYNYRQVSKALPYFLDAVDKSNKIKDQQTIPSESFRKIGYYMETIGDKAESYKYLKKALQNAQPNSSDRASALDAIGGYYLKENDIVNAEKYFEEAKIISKKINDDVRYAKVLGNIALIEEKKGQYDNAIALLKEDLHYSKQYEAYQNTMFALILLSKLYLQKNNIQDAKIALNEAETYAITKAHFKKSEREIIALELAIALKENNNQNELIARRKLAVLDKELNFTDGESALQRTNLMLQKERYNDKIALANAQYERELLIRKTTIAIIILLFALVIFIVINYRKKLKNKQHQYDKKILSFLLEKVQSEQNLQQTKKTLSSYRVYISEKNKQIEELTKSINTIDTHHQLTNQKYRLNELLESHLMTDENWRNFKNVFSSEYPEFYQSIIDFPEITESNLRVILLTKMGLTNNEISRLLGVTLDAIKKSKQRLRKKLGEKYENIFDSISPVNSI